MAKLRPAVANSDSAWIQFGFSFDSLIVTFWGGGGCGPVADIGVNAAYARKLPVPGIHSSNLPS